MEHPFFPTTTTRVESLRWLSIAEKLLLTRDLVGSKSFATRARDADPTLTPANQILAVADTLIAAERRIGNNHADWYAVLGLTPQQGQDTDLVASQYRNLVVLLNPQRNKFPLADEAFRLIVDAWSVLSNPSTKSLFDKELAFCLNAQQQQQDPFGNAVQGMHHNYVLFGGSSSIGVSNNTQSQAAVHFPQVQVNQSSQVSPVGATSAREPQKFMSFTPGSTLDFGSGSGIKVSQDTLNKQTRENHSIFHGNVAADPAATQEQVNNRHKQPQVNTSNPAEKAKPNVGVSDNAGAGTKCAEGAGRVNSQEGLDSPVNYDGPTFWTACPYCYYMYEYPMVYADCTLKCKNCKQAFQGVVVPSPPPVVDGQENCFCCWGFLPMGFSSENWEKNKGAASSWTPFSPMFTCPQPWNGNTASKQGRRKGSAPRVYIADDEVFVEISEPSESDDADWHDNKDEKRKRTKNVKRKGATGTPNKSAKKGQVDKGKNANVQDAVVSPDVVETPNNVAGEQNKKVGGVNARKQPGRVAKNFGKLDLNVEFSNEVEEPAPKVDQVPGSSRGEDDNIEGIGFFEGLDEFLSSLPILNVVADEKVVKAAS